MNVLVSIDSLIECRKVFEDELREVLEKDAPYSSVVQERIGSVEARISEEYTDAYFTGELDPVAGSDVSEPGLS